MTMKEDWHCSVVNGESVKILESPCFSLVPLSKDASLFDVTRINPDSIVALSSCRIVHVTKIC